MTDTNKAVNYSAEQVERMTSLYNEAETDAQRKEVVTFIAQEFGKKVRSVVSKLSSLKVYVVAAKATKTGAKVETKADIVAEIAELTGLTFTTLVKTSKAELTALRAFLLAQ